VKETDIQSAICRYLTKRNHFYWRQNNTGKMPGGGYSSVMKGIPDIIVIKAGRFIGIEVKKEKGRLSPEQVEFSRECVRNGGEYVVARSIDDVERAGL
jgi:Holliday junction resolvase